MGVPWSVIGTGQLPGNRFFDGSVKMTRLSYHRFRSNEVRLWLTIIAYNFGNLWRLVVKTHHRPTWKRQVRHNESYSREQLPWMMQGPWGLPCVVGSEFLQ